MDAAAGKLPDRDARRDRGSGSGAGRTPAPRPAGTGQAHDRPPATRGDAKRSAIVDAAMREFAERGYEGARIETIARSLGIAKGSVFQHFGSKSGLFLAAYRVAVRSLPRWQDAPEDVRAAGFFATVDHFLERTGHLVHEDLVPYRVTLIGDHGTDLAIKREINRWLAETDPYGTIEFVRDGVERGELRSDIPLEMLVGVLDWLVSRFQDAQVTEELDPGLFRRSAASRLARVSGAWAGPDEASPSGLTAARIGQFRELLRSAIGTAGR